MTIRPAIASDGAEWLRMRELLWPGDGHALEIAAHFAAESRAGVTLVAVRPGGGLGGFVEVELRSYAEDCESSPVPYIEGWYVDEDLRRAGVGRALIDAAMAWARDAGFSEIASDTLADNAASIAAHLALGFEKTAELVTFRRSLQDRSSPPNCPPLRGDMHMDASNHLDSLFREAVAAIDAGDVAALERLLAEHPELARERLDAPGAWLREQVGGAADRWFARPYLLWFVAEDPVRNGTLPANVAEVAREIIRAAERERAETLPEQLDFAIRLVAWSWIARKCGVQGELIDVLVDAGARLGENITHDALINGNFAGAERLVERGARLTLATALCLGRWNDAARIAETASAHDRQVALVLAALHGRADALRRLLALGVDLNAYSTDIYTHATALHHAVSSGSLDAVKVLVESGADLTAVDRAWDGTPLGWAEHYVAEAGDGDAGKQYPEIAAYLREKAGRASVAG